MVERWHNKEKKNIYIDKENFEELRVGICPPSTPPDPPLWLEATLVVCEQLWFASLVVYTVFCFMIFMGQIYHQSLIILEDIW
jgi:hypothetical protein